VKYIFAFRDAAIDRLIELDKIPVENTNGDIAADQNARRDNKDVFNLSEVSFTEGKGVSLNPSQRNIYHRIEAIRS
jgi:hypothetical protein